VCVCVCVLSLCTTVVHNATIQHRNVLIIFPPNLQTIIIAYMLSIEGEMSGKRPQYITWGIPTGIS